MLCAAFFFLASKAVPAVQATSHCTASTIHRRLLQPCVQADGIPAAHSQLHLLTLAASVGELALLVRARDLLRWLMVN
eukprot:SAG31_NODE_473_length_15222_cov_4.788005_4_plen_78_part_00